MIDEVIKRSDCAAIVLLILSPFCFVACGKTKAPVKASPAIPGRVQLLAGVAKVEDGIFSYSATYTCRKPGMEIVLAVNGMPSATAPLDVTEAESKTVVLKGPRIEPGEVKYQVHIVDGENTSRLLERTKRFD